MSRIVESLKELLKGKDEDDHEYGYRYDQRGDPGSKRYDGYPANVSSEGRSRYPVEGRSGYYADGNRGYPVTATVDERSGYAANSIPDVRSSYPTEGLSAYGTEGRRGYLADSLTEGRSGYPTEGRGRYPSDGRSGYPANSSPGGRSGYLADGRSSYPETTTSGMRSAYQANATAGGYRAPLRQQALDDDYVRSSYDTRSEARGEYRQPYESSPRGSEFRQAHGIRQASPGAASEYRASPRVEVPQRGEYLRTNQPSPLEYRPMSRGSLVELMVPMCCDKCEEKVEEELKEVDGVYSVRCDPKNSRVILRGDESIDIERCLTKAERAVKKKCELVSNQADVGTPKTVSSPSGYYETVAKTGILTPPPVSSSRSSPSGRPTLGRMPSFASGKVTKYDGISPHGQDYEAKDYHGFRRLPSFSKHRHHEAEYISSYDERPETWSSTHQEFQAPIRRMPSLNRSRHHDAEYLAADDDRDYGSHAVYDKGSSYTSSYNDRPGLLSQVSFSKIPVENPNYVKPITLY